MKILDQRHKIKGILGNWYSQYKEIIEDYKNNSYTDEYRKKLYGSVEVYRKKYDIYLELQKLDLSVCSKQEVDNIVGHPEWTDIRCEECGEIAETAIVFGEKECVVCTQCINRIWSLYF